MTKTLEPDLCVVGAGAAGLSAASIAASLGASVVLAERGTMGGDCLNHGCVPSKALIAAAERAHAQATSAPFGVKAREPEVDMLAVREHVRGVIAGIAPVDSVERYRALGVTVLQEGARFADARTLLVGETTIRPRRVVLATGSRPALPEIPGLDRTPHLTNETIFDLGRRPKHLLVIGAGPVGMELAQAFRRLGSAVTVIANGEALPREDREAAGIVVAALRADGVTVHEGAAIDRAEPAEEGVRVALRLASGHERLLDGSHLLVAVGRRPVVEDLGLEAAGIAHGPDGIRVDARLRTSNKRVYAIGDCATGGTGGLRLTHAAGQHASLVVRQALFGVPARFDPALVPRATYTDPEIASVGLSEEEAFAKDARARILRWPLAENDRARAERTTSGLIKAIVARNGRIMGCTIVAPHAGELIAPWTLALAKGLTARDLAGLVMPYPTLSEITKRAAVEDLKGLARNPWLGRLRNLVRWLG